jgi:hypothetical protein
VAAAEDQAVMRRVAMLLLALEERNALFQVALGSPRVQ